ncbi:hypothetical protein Q5752_003592 [Cryptotrichosporon argae]
MRIRSPPCAPSAALSSPGSDFYRTPELAGVAHNGGSVNNGHVQQLLHRMCASTPGAEHIVKGEVAALGRTGKRKVADGEAGQEGEDAQGSGQGRAL